MWAQRASLAAVATVLALGSLAARSDDGRKPPTPDPDPGFLEFLGSVDRLADVSPDYLAQVDPSRGAQPGARSAAPPPARPSPPPPPPPPPPPRQALPPSASADPGGAKNENE
jgi:hypothetical protein